MLEFADRKCSKCQEVKPLGEFYATASGGTHGRCKTCRREYSRQYGKRRPEIDSKAHRTYYRKHSKAISRRERLYRQTDRGKAMTLRANAVRRSRRNEACVPTAELRVLLVQHSVCAYCSHAFQRKGPYRQVWDHVIPLARGGRHTASNLLPACRRCNSDKGTKTPEEWVARWYLRGVGG